MKNTLAMLTPSLYIVWSFLVAQNIIKVANTLKLTQLLMWQMVYMYWQLYTSTTVYQHFLACYEINQNWTIWYRDMLLCIHSMYSLVEEDWLEDITVQLHIYQPYSSIQQKHISWYITDVTLYALYLCYCTMSQVTDRCICYL